jgi:hypothetical protein
MLHLASYKVISLQRWHASLPLAQRRVAQIRTGFAVRLRMGD